MSKTVPTNQQRGAETCPSYTLGKGATVISLPAVYCWNHEKETTVNKTGRQIAILKYKKGKTFGQLRIARLSHFKRETSTASQESHQRGIMKDSH